MAFLLRNEIKHAARVLSRYRDARRTRILRIRLRLTVRVKKGGRKRPLSAHRKALAIHPMKKLRINLLTASNAQAMVL